MIRIEYATMQAALACRAANNDVRYYLNGVLIDTDGNVVSTNGQIMFVGKVTGNAPTEKMLFRVPLKPPAKYDYVLIIGEIAQFWVSDTFVTVALEPIDGQYPQWQRLVNSYKNGECKAFGLNGKYLRLIGKIAKPFGDCAMLEPAEDSISMMRWTLQRVSDATTIAEKAHVYLMPCRFE